MATDLYSRDDTAMLLVDHQTGVMERVVRVPPLEEVKSNVAALAKAARVLEMPVVLTSNAEKYQGMLMPELEEILPDAYRMRIKRRGVVDALADPNVAAAVAATGRRNLILAGIGTDVCAVFPTIHALRDGYNVQVVADACGTQTALGHETALRRMEREGAILTSTPQIIAELAKDFSTPEGGQLVQIMAER
jgi:nicotinamidase-related amidase